MAGASDISTILSQAGRIEKINQSPFAQSDVTKQILTEDEARERLRKSREVNESQKGREIAAKDRDSKRDNQERKRRTRGKQKDVAKEDAPDKQEKHIIDVVV